MGLTTITAIAILAFNALMINAQAFTCECDGLDLPDWDDCKRSDGSVPRPFANDERKPQVQPSPAR
jgi:hypothetical protein